MRKLFFAIIVVLLVNIDAVPAQERDFAETTQLIDSGIDCDELTDEQREAIGDYYMEQMHPAGAHEVMDQMLGGEGSDSLKQTHIQIAKRLYCNEDIGGMMGGGMMSAMMGNTMMGSGIMGNLGYGLGYWSFMNMLYAILLIGLVILVYLWILRLWTDLRTTGGKNEAWNSHRHK